MTTLTSQTSFEIEAPAEVYTEIVDLVLLPENNGLNVMRELRYPADALPPLIYAEPPDSWQNFDNAPLTGRPSLASQQTIEDTVFNIWPGYLTDNPVLEIWKGSDTVARMPAYFLRRLLEYFLNPPPDGTYITWWPKDRTSQGYNIQIEGLRAGNAVGSTSGTSKAADQQDIVFDGVALSQGYVMGEVIFSFRIISEVS